MPRLMFPKKDKRSNGEPFNRKRPWLFHGAKCRVAYDQVGYYTTTVHFNGAPREDNDIVTPEFLK